MRVEFGPPAVVVYGDDPGFPHVPRLVPPDLPAVVLNAVHDLILALIKQGVFGKAVEAGG